MQNNVSKTPLTSYEEQVQSGALQFNAEQKKVVLLLDNLFQELIKPKTVLQKLKIAKTNPPQGIYLWGSVGSGKTVLIDNFFHALPFDDKLRMHFHAFMQVVHAELTAHKGKSNPLQFVAKEFAQKTRVLCLDELIVNDIADAMILAELFKYLYSQGLCILFTTNIYPDRLYEKGLQRQRFVPAIELIKAHSVIAELNISTDFRQQHKQHNLNYFAPYDNDAMEKRFRELARGNISNDPISVHNRAINVVKRSDNCIWFDFDTICGVPRSQKDFLSIVKEYPVIFLSNLHVISERQHNLIRSLINFIDVLYDNNILLIISAEKPIHQIYPAGKFLFPFARTQSRITEMASESWTG